MSEPVLTPSDVDAALQEQQLHWTHEGEEITTTVKLHDFVAALEFVRSVGDAAEAANHHPDILLHGWNKVRLTLSTHSEGGLTEADFSMAGQIDRIA